MSEPEHNQVLSTRQGTIDLVFWVLTIGPVLFGFGDAGHTKSSPVGILVLLAAVAIAGVFAPAWFGATRLAEAGASSAVGAVMGIVIAAHVVLYGSTSFLEYFGGYLAAGVIAWMMVKALSRAPAGTSPLP